MNSKAERSRLLQINKERNKCIRVELSPDSAINLIAERYRSVQSDFTSDLRVRNSDPDLNVTCSYNNQ